jgi:hypothetical protein
LDSNQGTDSSDFTIKRETADFDVNIMKKDIEEPRFLKELGLRAGKKLD